MDEDNNNDPLLTHFVLTGGWWFSIQDLGNRRWMVMLVDSVSAAQPSSYFDDTHHFYIGDSYVEAIDNMVWWQEDVLLWPPDIDEE